jgi:inner membrane protein
MFAGGQGMRKPMLVKAVVVAVIFATLFIPLSMIRGLVAERGARKQEVTQEIAASSFGRQIFAGPVLSLPYTEEYVEEVGEGRDRRVERHRIERTLRMFPASLEATGAASVGEKHRGLFKARTYTWRASARGEFVLDGRIAIERTRADSRIIWGEPLVSILLSDPRGLASAPVFEWAGQRIAFERGSGVPGMPSGLHAAVEVDPTKAQRLPFSLQIALQGTESLGIVPLADNNQVSLESEWRHPSFGGQFLPQPETQRIGKDGFVAEWRVTALGSSAQQQMQAAFGGPERGLASAERLDVAFIDPIDIYALSDRALKYGFLFIVLTFACFALFEVRKGLRIHPAQYGLVGLALAVFFLLLLALSEHLMFWIAYLIAAIACIALIGFYLSSVLHSVSRGASCALMLTALYSALYAMLISEDNALLFGSLLVFGVLAIAMVLTRNVDWYREGSPRDAPKEMPAYSVGHAGAPSAMNRTN